MTNQNHQMNTEKKAKSKQESPAERKKLIAKSSDELLITDTAEESETSDFEWDEYNSDEDSCNSPRRSSSIEVIEASPEFKLLARMSKILSEADDSGSDWDDSVEDDLIPRGNFDDPTIASGHPILETASEEQLASENLQVKLMDEFSEIASEPNANSSSNEVWGARSERSEEEIINCDSYTSSSSSIYEDEKIIEGSVSGVSATPLMTIKEDPGCASPKRKYMPVASEMIVCDSNDSCSDWDSSTDDGTSKNDSSCYGGSTDGDKVNSESLSSDESSARDVIGPQKRKQIELKSGMTAAEVDDSDSDWDDNTLDASECTNESIYGNAEEKEYGQRMLVNKQLKKHAVKKSNEENWTEGSITDEVHASGDQGEDSDNDSGSDWGEDEDSSESTDADSSSTEEKQSSDINAGTDDLQLGAAKNEADTLLADDGLSLEANDEKVEGLQENEVVDVTVCKMAGVADQQAGGTREMINANSCHTLKSTNIFIASDTESDSGDGCCSDNEDKIEERKSSSDERDQFSAAQDVDALVMTEASPSDKPTSTIGPFPGKPAAKEGDHTSESSAAIASEATTAPKGNVDQHLNLSDDDEVVDKAAADMSYDIVTASSESDATASKDDDGQDLNMSDGDQNVDKLVQNCEDPPQTENDPVEAVGESGESENSSSDFVEAIEGSMSDCKSSEGDPFREQHEVEDDLHKSKAMIELSDAEGDTSEKLGNCDGERCEETNDVLLEIATTSGSNDDLSSPPDQPPSLIRRLFRMNSPADYAVAGTASPPVENPPIESIAGQGNISAIAEGEQIQSQDHLEESSTIVATCNVENKAEQCERKDESDSCDENSDALQQGDIAAVPNDSPQSQAVQPPSLVRRLLRRNPRSGNPGSETVVPAEESENFQNAGIAQEAEEEGIETCVDGNEEAHNQSPELLESGSDELKSFEQGEGNEEESDLEQVANSDELVPPPSLVRRLFRRSSRSCNPVTETDCEPKESESMEEQEGDCPGIKEEDLGFHLKVQVEEGDSFEPKPIAVLSDGEGEAGEGEYNMDSYEDTIDDVQPAHKFCDDQSSRPSESPPSLVRRLFRRNPRSNNPASETVVPAEESENFQNAGIAQEAEEEGIETCVDGNEAAHNQSPELLESGSDELKSFEQGEGNEEESDLEQVANSDELVPPPSLVRRLFRRSSRSCNPITETDCEPKENESMEEQEGDCPGIKEEEGEDSSESKPIAILSDGEGDAGEGECNIDRGDDTSDDMQPASKICDDQSSPPSEPPPSLVRRLFRRNPRCDNPASEAVDPANEENDGDDISQEGEEECANTCVPDEECQLQLDSGLDKCKTMDQVENEREDNGETLEQSTTDESTPPPPSLVRRLFGRSPRLDNPAVSDSDTDDQDDVDSLTADATTTLVDSEDNSNIGFSDTIKDIDAAVSKGDGDRSEEEQARIEDDLHDKKSDDPAPPTPPPPSLVRRIFRGRSARVVDATTARTNGEVENDGNDECIQEGTVSIDTSRSSDDHEQMEEEDEDDLNEKDFLYKRSPAPPSSLVKHLFARQSHSAENVEEGADAAAPQELDEIMDYSTMFVEDGTESLNDHDDCNHEQKTSALNTSFSEGSESSSNSSGGSDIHDDLERPLDHQQPSLVRRLFRRNPNEPNDQMSTTSSIDTPPSVSTVAEPTANAIKLFGPRDDVVRASPDKPLQEDYLLEILSGQQQKRRRWIRR